jgi:hypothetical protein
MKDSHETPSVAKEVGALFVYAVTGAALAVLGIFLIDQNGHDSRSVAALDATARACPLSASPDACDACMLSACLAPCRTCAGNPACLQLFACMMDCTDERCEAACAKTYPDGTEDLSAFLGVDGCLARHCTDSCP